MGSDLRGLWASAVRFAYGTVPVVRDVTLGLPPGSMLALAGPNGSGKTTLLKLLAGGLQPDAGSVTLDGVDIEKLGRRGLARSVAVVPQHLDTRLPFAVTDLVTMGRTPYIGFLGSATAADRSAVGRALMETEIEALAHRRFPELSGGEQQRVMLAMALAQETDYLLLDEPTVHLDLHHQHELLELLSALQRQRNIGVLAIMHDLNLASLYFERVAVMSEGRLVAEGPAGDVLQDAGTLSVFAAPLAVVSHPQTGAPQVLLERRS